MALETKHLTGSELAGCTRFFLIVSRFLYLLVVQRRPWQSKCTYFGDETEHVSRVHAALSS